MVHLFTINPLLLMNRRFRSIRPPIRPLVTPRNNAMFLVASPAIPMSWTRGQPLRSLPRSPPVGAKTMTCSIAPSQWTCAHKRTKSSARGCSQQPFVHISSTTQFRGETPAFRDGCSTPIARRCRSRRATSSLLFTCSSNTAPMPFAIGQQAHVLAPTPRSTKDR
ncbi:unannotated protein [freshwater metagenome]|uniref:Unannotated protein n=1 Tax=freshwater metagenome TaxID=449393 RepID=A0A6J7M270_9ZZZZ